MLPLYFQAVNLDSAAVAGAHMIVPSLVGIIGSICAGITMSRWGHLSKLMKIGSLIMLIGGFMVATFGEHTANWRYISFLMPTQFGNSLLMPAVLFSILAHFPRADHAVATGACYLIRSIGLVLGVAVTNTIAQNSLSTVLPRLLQDMPNKNELFDIATHSITAIKTLEPHAQSLVIQAYVISLRRCFLASAFAATLSFIASLFSQGSGLRRKEDDEEEANGRVPKVTTTEEEFL